MNLTEIVATALAEDLGPLGDLTASLLPAKATGDAMIVPRNDGVLAGCAAAHEAFSQVDTRVAVAWTSSDGDRVRAGDAVARVVGPLASVLSAERTALNFLSHLSGIATLTRRYVDAAGADLVLLDNMTPAQVRDCVERVAKRCLVEVSGGVNLGTIDDYAATGADLVAIGALTHSAPILDIGLDLTG